MKQKTIGILLFGLLLSGQALAFEPVKVIDGDSLFVDHIEIRLSGIDAPEYSQTCKDSEGKDYSCGQMAFEALKELAGQDTKCNKIVTDKYHRQVSVCTSRGININNKMVEDGWAVAYSRYTNEYDEAQKNATKNKVGIWQGRFMKPEFYRILQKDKKNHQFD